MRRIATLIVFAFALLYLFLPPPPIPQIGKSYPFEIGEVSQLMGKPIGVYYTNLSQKEAIKFYLKHYSRSSLLNLPLLTKKIDYSPRYAKEIINDMHEKNTSFLTEVSHPMRESIILKGYGEISPEAITQKENKKVIQFKPEKNKQYNLKILVYYIESPIWARVLVLIGIFMLTPIILKRIYESVKEIRDNKY